MADCPFCHKYVPEGVVRCPHCSAALQPTDPSGRQVLSPFEARLRAAPARPLPGRSRPIGRLPASRLGLLGCLGLVALVLLAAVLLAVLSPNTVRTLLVGKPTPLPPTPRPTMTPSPVPTPTPEWTSYQVASKGYTVALPPYWLVIDFGKSNWEEKLSRAALWYSWLEREIPAERQTEEAALHSVWAFDPRRLGHFSVRFHLDPELAGMTVDQLQSSLRQKLLQIPGQFGGRAPGGIRVEKIRIDGREAAFFELVMLPGAGSAQDKPVKFQFYVLTDALQGYWIEVTGLEEELAQDAPMVQVMLDQFHVTAREGQRDD